MRQGSTGGLRLLALVLAVSGACGAVPGRAGPPAPVAAPAAPEPVATPEPKPEPAAEAALPPEAGAVVEEATLLPVEIEGRHYALDTLVVRRPGDNRLPVALITHGTAEGDPRAVTMGWLRQWAHEMAHRGWLAVAVLRRGYGRSEGSVFDDYGTCQAPDIGRYLDANADDLQAALVAITRRPDADVEHAIAIGDSAGGAAALALAARRKPALAAVINVSGGLVYSRSAFHPEPNCGLFESDLVWNLARFGDTAPMPTLWLYAENDALFRPGLVGRMKAAYTGAGGRADLVMLPPFRGDGHTMFFAAGGRQRLLPELDRFLREQRLPTWDPAPFAPLLARLSGANRRGVEEYLSSAPTEKALALAPDGQSFWYYGSPTLERARCQVLKYCEEEAGAACRLVADDYTVLPEAGK